MGVGWRPGFAVEFGRFLPVALLKFGQSTRWALVHDFFIAGNLFSFGPLLPTDVPSGRIGAMNGLTGKRAIPFELNDQHGKQHNLESSSGKWLLLMFHRHLG